MPLLQELRSFFIDCSKPAKSWDDQLLSKGLHVAAALKSYLQNKALNLITKAAQQPILYFYTSDATSYMCSKRIDVATADQQVTRHGKHNVDFLMEFGCVTTITAVGKIRSAILVREPREMSDKSTWAQFTAMCEFFPLAFKDKNDGGITITQVAWDRAIESSLQRKREQLHEGYWKIANKDAYI